LQPLIYDRYYQVIAICILLICVFDKSNGKKVYVKIKLDLYKKKIIYTYWVLVKVPRAQTNIAV